MKILSLIILLLLALSLQAQTQSLDDLVKSARNDIARNPADVKLRLNLAYLLMLKGDTQDALSNYRTVLQQDSLNADAASGELWALNTLGQWKQTLEKSQLYLSLHPEQAPLYNFRGFALAQTGYAARARSAYKQTLKLDPPDLLALHAHKGMGWSYLALQDYPAALKAFRRAEKPITDEAVLRALNKVKLTFSLNGASNYDSTYTYGAQLGLRYRRLSAGLAWEELKVGAEPFRHSYQATLGYSTDALDITLKGSYLQGEDARAYPGTLGSAELRTKIYLGSVVFTPDLTQHLGIYERFNIYQSDLGLSVLIQPLLATYSYSYIYEDTDSVGADVEGAVHSLHLAYKLPGDYSLGAYATLGDRAWWTSPFGVTIDDFEPVDTVFGLSLYAPLPWNFSVMLYHQLGLSGSEIHQLSSINVSYHI